MTNLVNYCIIHITTGSIPEAETIAKTLVEERLAACCSVIPAVRSVYRWEGKTQHDEECLILCKTVEAVFPRIERRVRELHSYDLPELIMTPVTGGSEAYLAWVSASVDTSL
jgi:periplasmic divalent cation tolerance protein